MARRFKTHATLWRCRKCGFEYDARDGVAVSAVSHRCWKQPKLRHNRLHPVTK